jgi:hypothetical protein
MRTPSLRGVLFVSHEGTMLLALSRRGRMDFAASWGRPAYELRPGFTCMDNQNVLINMEKFILRNFTMVGKNMGHSLVKIGRCKNRRYPCESTWKYQISRDNTKIGGTSTKIGGPLLHFFQIYLVLDKINLVISDSH